MIAIRGSTATVRRSTQSLNTDLTVNRTYTTVQNGLQVDLSVLDRKAAQMKWGEETKATVRGLCPVGSQVKEGDGLQVQTGLYAGRKLRVEGVRDFKDSMGTDHIELALDLTTTETFA